MNVAKESIVVNRPVAELYRRWLRFEELPQFIKSIRNVQRIDDTHFSFMADDDGVEHHGILDVIFRNPERRIAWRIISDGVGLGVVSFEPQGSSATEVTLKLSSAFNPLLSVERAKEYLAEFKKLAEMPPT